MLPRKAGRKDRSRRLFPAGTFRGVVPAVFSDTGAPAVRLPVLFVAALVCSGACRSHRRRAWPISTRSGSFCLCPRVWREQPESRPCLWGRWAGGPVRSPSPSPSPNAIFCGRDAPVCSGAVSRIVDAHDSFRLVSFAVAGAVWATGIPVVSARPMGRRAGSIAGIQLRRIRSSTGVPHPFLPLRRANESPAAGRGLYKAEGVPLWEHLRFDSFNAACRKLL